VPVRGSLSSYVRFICASLHVNAPLIQAIQGHIFAIIKNTNDVYAVKKFGEQQNVTNTRMNNRVP
jgi:hypothetical protein